MLNKKQLQFKKNPYSKSNANFIQDTTYSPIRVIYIEVKKNLPLKKDLIVKLLFSKSGIILF